MTDQSKNITYQDAIELIQRLGKDSHSVSAPETKERLAKLETNQNNLMQEIQELKQMIKDLGIKIDCVIENKADKTDLEKKSDRWVQNFVVGFIVIVGTGFLGVVGTLIYQAIIHFGR